MAHLPPEDLRFVLSKRGLSGDVAVRGSRQICRELRRTDPSVQARLCLG